ncbi:hypothetical protein [Aquimarina pacifica]|uniref:hypothetical protein n=1 Tax=Aquimarina pacifica TaxID=1296415 RepID=UPI00046FF0C6|nr:hypothetical protein [Aquimarina pacifica]
MKKSIFLFETLSKFPIFYSYKKMYLPKVKKNKKSVNSSNFSNRISNLKRLEDASTGYFTTDSRINMNSTKNNKNAHILSIKNRFIVPKKRVQDVPLKIVHNKTGTQNEWTHFCHDFSKLAKRKNNNYFTTIKKDIYLYSNRRDP